MVRREIGVTSQKGDRVSWSDGIGVPSQKRDRGAWSERR